MTVEKQNPRHATVNIRAVYTRKNRGMFFWDYSIYSNSRIDGTCVLLGAIPIPEWTECYSVHSAPDSRMDGAVFWREKCASTPVSFDHVSYSVFGIMHELFKLGTDILGILIFHFQNRNKQNSPKRMRPKPRITQSVAYELSLLHDRQLVQKLSFLCHLYGHIVAYISHRLCNLQLIFPHINGPIVWRSKQGSTVFCCCLLWWLTACTQLWRCC